MWRTCVAMKKEFIGSYNSKDEVYNRPDFIFLPAVSKELVRLDKCGTRRNAGMLVVLRVGVLAALRFCFWPPKMKQESVHISQYRVITSKNSADVIQPSR